jgi:hypothetical protein
MSQRDNRNVAKLEVIVVERNGVTLSLEFYAEYGNLGVFPKPKGGPKYRAVMFFVSVGTEAYQFHCFEEALKKFRAESGLSAS